MELSSVNPYRHLAQYQQPAVMPEKPDLITIPEFEKPELSPENRLKLQDRIEEIVDEKEAAEQAEKDALRELTAQYVGTQSKKTQWEIYMSVATDSAVDLDDGDGIEFIRTLRDIQTQNNLVKAYAAYQENADDAAQAT